MGSAGLVDAVVGDRVGPMAGAVTVDRSSAGVSGFSRLLAPGLAVGAATAMGGGEPADERSAAALRLSWRTCTARAGSARQPGPADVGTVPSNHRCSSSTVAASAQATRWRGGGAFLLQAEGKKWSAVTPQ